MSLLLALLCLLISTVTPSPAAQLSADQDILFAVRGKNLALSSLSPSPSENCNLHDLHYTLQETITHGDKVPAQYSGFYSYMDIEGENVRVYTSEDGITWASQLINHASCTPSWTRLVTSSKKAFAFVICTTNDAYLSTSTDGTVFSALSKFNTPQFDSLPNGPITCHPIELIEDGDKLTIVGQSKVMQPAGYRSRFFTRVSEDGGETWGDFSFAVSEQAEEGHIYVPTATMSSGGVYNVYGHGYLPSFGGDGDVVEMVSFDKGLTWEVPVVPRNNTSKENNIQVLSHGHSMLLCYTDTIRQYLVQCEYSRDSGATFEVLTPRAKDRAFSTPPEFGYIVFQHDIDDLGNTIMLGWNADVNPKSLYVTPLHMPSGSMGIRKLADIDFTAVLPVGTVSHEVVFFGLSTDKKGGWVFSVTVRATDASDVVTQVTGLYHASC